MKKSSRSEVLYKMVALKNFMENGNISGDCILALLPRQKNDLVAYKQTNTRKANTRSINKFKSSLFIVNSKDGIVC